MAREEGFKNINVDLMIGLPNQSISNIKESLNKVITFKSFDRVVDYSDYYYIILYDSGYPNLWD